jgi:hypothetical protein
MKYSYNCVRTFQYRAFLAVALFRILWFLDDLLSGKPLTDARGLLHFAVPHCPFVCRYVINVLPRILIKIGTVIR